MKVDQSRAIALLFGGLLGVLISAAFTARDYLRFDGIVTSGNLLQAGTTLFVAVLVSGYLQRRASVDRTQKDLLLEVFDAAIESLSRLEDRLPNGVYVEITAALKKVRVSCNFALEQSEEMGFALGASKSSIKEQVLAIRRLATETPVIDEAVKGVSRHVTFLDGRVTYSADRMGSLESKIEALRLDLLRKKISIDRSPGEV